MLHYSVRIEVPDKKVHKPIKKEDKIEVDEHIQTLGAQSDLTADHDGGQDDPRYEDELGEVVPLHVPVVLGVDNELAHLLGLQICLVLTVLVLVELDAFNHTLDCVATHPGHHADDFLLFANSGP